MSDNVSLTPEEQRRLKPLFNQYDLEDSSIVLGDRVRPLLEKSGLPPAQLGQIWQLVDTDNRGFLDFTAFAKCMRLIAHAQQGLAVSPRIANIPSGMPDFNRAAATPTSPASPPPVPLQQPHLHQHGSGNYAHSHAHQPSSGSQTHTQVHTPMATLNTGSSTSSSGESRVHPLTTADKKRYGELFDRSVSVQSGTDDRSLLDGTVARDIFLKARLPEDTLGKIWALVDVEGRGKLTKNEFVVAMHLIQVTMNGSMPALPSVLPPSWQPWLGSGHGRRGSIIMSPVPQHQQLHVLPPTAEDPTTAPATTAARAPAADRHSVASTHIASQERAQYDAIFDSLDSSRTGILGPELAVPVLTKSGLSEDVLAKVWDLVDTHSRGQLDKGDFALAMHFVKAKLNGQQLPEHVAPGAGASGASPGVSARVQSPPPQPAEFTGKAATAAGATNSAAFQPHPPTRAATASSLSSPTASSLSDLVSLDSAVFLDHTKEQPTAKLPRRAQTDSFIPSTAFGQQLLQKSTASASAGTSGAAEASGAAGSSAGTSAADAGVAGADTAGAGTSGVGAAATAASTGAASGGVERDMAQLEEQIKAQKAAAARANEELAQILKRKAELEGKVEELRIVYDAGTKEVHAAQQAVAAEKEAVKQLERDIVLRTSGLDAIKAQHGQEQATLAELTTRKTTLEKNVSEITTETETLRVSIQTILVEHEQHKRSISEHERSITEHQSRKSTLLEELEGHRSRRTELETEAARHSERALQAKAEAEEHTRRAQEEAQAAQAAHAEMERQREESQRALAEAEQRASMRMQAQAELARARAEHEMAMEQHNAAIAAATLRAQEAHTPQVVQTTVRDAQPTTAPSTTTAEADVAGTGVAEVAPQVTGEVEDINRETSMPSFTLPMQRPMSGTSSVVNHAPQSVRGDLGSELGEVPPMERSDSFEFVDARETGEGFADNSSDDEDGPAGAVPHRYSETLERVPAMPGAFPASNSSLQLSHKNLSVPDALQLSAHNNQDGAHSVLALSGTANGSAALTTTSTSTVAPTAAPAAAPIVASTTAPTALTASQQAPSDDFDDFDDLEEAREDEGDAFPPKPMQNNAQAPPYPETAGPDEWQQLFAGAAPQATGGGVPPFSFGVPPQDSPDIAELTSMGFSSDDARQALKMHNNNVSEATNYLLDRLQ